ncbi:MAG: nucleotidyltransferase family protein [Chloroflexota bacterium]
MSAPTSGPDLDAPVHRLLLACLRARWDPTALEAARALAAEPALDWEALTRLAQAERISPLLYAVGRHAEWLPGPVLERLRRDYMLTAARNALYLGALARALARLEAAGIAAIVLKGAALAETLYEQIAVRPLGDLDLLVQREDGAAALAALAELGYAPLDPEARPGAALAWENEVCLTCPQPLPHLLEIHWSLFDSPHYQQRLAMDWFWDTAQRATVGGREALILGPEAQLVHLCGHLALHHEGQGWLWHHDIAELLARRGATLDWGLALEQAERGELVVAMQTVLGRVAAAWQAPIPPAALARLAALRPSPAEMRAMAPLSAPSATVAGRFWADLAAMPGWRARLRYALESLFPSSDYMRQRYAIRHGWLLPLYYPWRWWVGLVQRRR